MNRLLLAGRLLVLLAAVAGARGGKALEIRHFTRLSPRLATVVQSPRELPVTCQADVVVAGGGVSGTVAALRAAAEGCSVVIVEERNCLGCEATTQWTLLADGTKIGADCPTAAKLASGLTRSDDKSPQRVSADRCKSLLHRQVAAQPRIRVFFASLPAGVLLEQGRVQGLVVVNRAGRQVFLARAVVDATDDDRVAAAAGAEFQPVAGPRHARRLIAASPLPTGALKCPGQDADSDVAVWHGLLAITCKTPSTGNAALDWSTAQASTLTKANQLRDALAAAHGPFTSFTVSPEVALEAAAAVRRREGIAQRPVGVEGLTMARPAAPDASLAAALASGETAGRLAVEIAQETHRALETQRPVSASATGGVRELLCGPDAGAGYPVVVQAEAVLPVAAEVDVLVIGGGTSGALAAIAAGRQGARVILIETLPNMGGTSSNRVNSYYWGVPWKSELSEEIDAACVVLPRKLRAGGLQKVGFSGEDKKAILQQLALAAGVQIRYRSFGAGALLDGNRLVGAVIEDASGRHAIRARVVIDATGQGDVAAAAGAAFHVGRPTDGFLNEAEHGPLRDALDPEDLSKFYLRYPQQALSLNIRESRRIEGDYTVTFADVLADRRFPDVIARWRSNYDTHFPHSANEDDAAQDWVAILGLFRKPLWGSIPLRAILPHGLENLLVVGKAYSATHDALMGGRMQRDLQHLGEAAGIAAAMACQQKVPVRKLPIAELQANLVRLGVLLPEELSEAQSLPSNSPRIDLAATAARLGTADALEAMTELYRAGAASAEPLLPLLKSADAAQRTEAALVLGMLGRAESVPVLLERLHERDARTFAFTLPDASSRASVPVYYSAVILLGRQKVQAAVKPIVKLIKDPKSCAPDLASFAIVALERIGDPAAVPAIKPYLALSEPATLVEENRHFETHWGVRTNAARALARLGDQSGVPVLIELLDADQSRLRNYAQRLLEEISGRSFGKDRAAWQQWWKASAVARPEKKE